MSLEKWAHIRLRTKFKIQKVFHAKFGLHFNLFSILPQTVRKNFPRDLIHGLHENYVLN